MSWRVQKIVMSHFLTGFICWYGIEKVFQRSIGITVFQISIMAVLYIATSTLLNVPTGVLADRYGRKYAILLAAIALLLCTIIAGNADNFLDYSIAVMVWGIFYTTQYGAYEAILYDTLKEEGSPDKYARYSGLSNAGFWIAIFISSLIGAYLGSHYGLRVAYYITIIPGVLNIVLALSLKEPKIHESDTHVTSLSMIKQGFKNLNTSPKIIYLSAVYLVILLPGWAANEFGQLYFIELGFTVFVIGVLNAFSGLFQASGNYFGYKFAQIPSWFIVMSLLVVYVLTFAMPIKYKVIGTALFMLLVFLRHTYYIANNAKLQHLLPSETRATSISSLGMINDVILIFAYLSFGYLSQRTSVRAGFLVFIAYGVLIMLGAKYLSSRSTSQTPPEYINGKPIIAEVDSFPK